MDKDFLIEYVKKFYRTPIYKATERDNDEFKDWNDIDIEFDIWKTQVKFLKNVKRIDYDLTDETLADIIERVNNEDERFIEIRIEL